jgi:tRNA A-37 threonylcarbamoyl transferase component Bud32
VVFLYRQRGLPLSEVVTGPAFIVLAGLFLVTIVAARVRQRILSFLDRRFFREQYDAQEILTTLVEAARWVDSARDLAALVTADVDRALHLQKVDLLLMGPGESTLRSPLSGEELRLRDGQRPADLSSGVVELTPHSQSADDQPPSSDESDLGAKGWALLSPLVGSARNLLGLLLIGEKKSELGFSGSDRRLLSAVAASSAMALENLWARRSLAPLAAGAAQVARPDEDAAPACECPQCGRVFSTEVAVCLLCEATLVEARVPSLLVGKFAVERRIGKGGMGIVYLATDLHLERPVAIKTLPELRFDRARRLLEEARAMASVTHPSLATIYGAEEWRRNPLLILEYLSGGDLRLRLRGGPLDVDRALAVALAIAGALKRIHGAGLLHRDVKPSNVGFTEHGEPKLLDFGLARLLREEADLSAPLATGSVATALGAASAESATTLAAQIVGTPAYLPPEALTDAPPTPAFDLWALAVVLFETLVGRNPFAAATRDGTFANILRLDLGPILEQAALPPPVTNLLERALSRDRARRPRTAAEFEDLLAPARRGSHQSRRVSAGL